MSERVCDIDVMHALVKNFKIFRKKKFKYNFDIVI